MSQAVRNAAPPMHAYAQLIKRARRDEAKAPENPRGYDFEIPDRYKFYNASNGHEEVFLLCDFKVPLSHNRGNARWDAA